MGRFFTYMMIITGLMLLFYFAGLTAGGSVTSSQIGTIDLLMNFKSFNIWEVLSSNISLLVGTATGIVIGYLTRSTPQIALSALICSTLFGAFIGDLILIARIMSDSGAEWMGVVAILIIAPLTIGFGMTMWEWIRASD